MAKRPVNRRPEPCRILSDLDTSTWAIRFERLVTLASGYEVNAYGGVYKSGETWMMSFGRTTELGSSSCLVAPSSLAFGTTSGTFVAAGEHSSELSGRVSGEVCRLFLGSFDGKCSYHGEISEGGVQ